MLLKRRSPTLKFFRVVTCNRQTPWCPPGLGDFFDDLGGGGVFPGDGGGDLFLLGGVELEAGGGEDVVVAVHVVVLFGAELGLKLAGLEEDRVLLAPRGNIPIRRAPTSIPLGLCGSPFHAAFVCLPLR